MLQSCNTCSVRDTETMQPVAPDGETIGEVMLEGKIVMKGELTSRQATGRPSPAGPRTLPRRCAY